MEIGIIGLPNVGKSTLFNSLTKAYAPVSNYPFTTINPNIGVVSVPDKRLDVLFEIFRPKKKTPAHIKFVDIAGLVRGASRGEGLGNKFLASIREVDAILHVVRAFKEPNVSHILTSIDPVRDIEIVETELILADLEMVERIIEKTRNAAKSGDQIAKEKMEKLEKLKSILSSAKPASASGYAPEEIKEFNLLTSKPVLYVVNVSEKREQEIFKRLESLFLSKKVEYVEISAKIESELSELPDDEKKLFLKEMGLESTGLERLIAASQKLLQLISFFTVVGTEESRSWIIKQGTKAAEAAGYIHSDMEKGFIRADVYSFEDIEKYRDEKVLHEKGLIRSEGRDYVIKDGDVCFFKFHV